MKLPSFQFYPGDWRKDPNLSRATHEEKGVWMDMLCLMHECEERGVLATAGIAWTDEDISFAVGGDLTRTLSCVKELVRKGIAKRNSVGAIYSARMVLDEHKRKACSEAGKRGGNPTLKGVPKGVPKGDSKGPPTPSVSSSSSSSKQEAPPLSPPGGEAVVEKRGKKRRAEETVPHWQVLVDYLSNRWCEKKRAKFYWRPQHFKNLKSLAGLYQPYGVMALWDLYLGMDDQWVRGAGHSFEMFLAKIPALVDNPVWKIAAKKHEDRLCGPIDQNLVRALTQITSR